MEKYKSKIINPENIKIETDWYYENGIKHEAVKLTDLKFNIEVVVSSQKGQISAYNLALKKLEDKFLKIASKFFCPKEFNLKKVCKEKHCTVEVMERCWQQIKNNELN